MSSIYFIQSIDGGPIKIGRSVDVQERMRTFQTASPTQLELLHVEPGGSARESQFHRRFKQHRIPGGEWFEPAPEILDYIAHPDHRAPRRWRTPHLQVPGWVGQLLAAVPVGAWRILTALILYALSPRARRRRRVSQPAALGILAAAGSAGSYWLAMPYATPAAITLTVLACAIASTTRRR